MKLLLRKDISKVCLAGDIVDVKEGYARNYLIPQNLGLLPTKANMKAIEEDKKSAEAERKMRRAALEAAAQRMREVEITIAAVCNEDGHLYGSVGPREIAAALRDEGHAVDAKQVQLREPIRQLDNVTVPVVFTDDLVVEVKVWVVRETAAGTIDESDEPTKDESTTTEADAGTDMPSVSGTETGDGDTTEERSAGG